MILSAYASGDYSSAGGGYTAQQYSVPPPALPTGDNYGGSSGAQTGGYGAQNYGGQSVEWNTSSPGSYLKSRFF